MAEQNKIKLDIERELKNEKTNEDREKAFMTNFQRSETEITKQYGKQLAEIEKMYPDPGPERDAKELAVRRTRDAMHNELVKTYKPIADRYKIPFAYEPRPEKVAEADDPHYTAAKNVIMAMPPGSARDSKLAALEARRAQLQQGGK